MVFFASYRPVVLSVFRIMVGLLLLQHGTTKYLGFPHSSMTGVSPFTMPGIAGLLELVGGVLLVLGLFTRATAFVLSGMLAVAYFYAHAPQGFYPLLNGGELAVLYCFALLYIAAAGGGPLALDRMRSGDDEAELLAEDRVR